MHAHTLLRYVAVLAVLLLGVSEQALGQQKTFPVTTPAGALPSSGSVEDARKVGQNEETLRYYGDVEFVDFLSPDQPAYVVRLSPSLTGELSQVAFPLFDGPYADGGSAPGVQGTGILRLELFEASSPTALPALSASGYARMDTSIVDLVANGEIPPSPFNEIEMLGEGFDVEAGQDYFLRLMLDEASDDAVLSFVSDSGSTDMNDPAYYPPRTTFYVRGDALEPDEEEGFFIYENNANLVIDVTVEGVPSTATDPFDAEVPEAFALKQNYPNPFNPTTSLAFDLPRSEEVTLTVYNMLGEEVARLVDRRLAAGTYTVTWNARGQASGIYLARLRAGSFVQTRRMVLVK